MAAADGGPSEGGVADADVGGRMTMIGPPRLVRPPALVRGVAAT